MLYSDGRYLVYSSIYCFSFLWTQTKCVVYSFIKACSTARNVTKCIRLEDLLKIVSIICPLTVTDHWDDCKSLD